MKENEIIFLLKSSCSLETFSFKSEMRNLLRNEATSNNYERKSMILLILSVFIFFAACEENDPSTTVVIPPENTESCDSTSSPLQTAHFLFYFTSIDTNICEISDSLENNYYRIINDLQTDTLPVINVHFYDNHDSLVEAVAYAVPNLPSWAIGLATEEDQIYLMSPNYTGYSFQYMITNLIHEYAHCVSMHINPTIGNNPRWLWESVAIFEARQFLDPQNVPYMVNHNPPTLATLNSFSNTMIYDVGYLIAEFIVETWDYSHLNDLIENNGNLQSTLGMTNTEFEDAWFEFVQTKYGI